GGGDGGCVQDGPSWGAALPLGPPDGAGPNAGAGSRPLSIVSPRGPPISGGAAAPSLAGSVVACGSSPGRKVGPKSGWWKIQFASRSVCFKGSISSAGWGWVRGRSGNATSVIRQPRKFALATISAGTNGPLAGIGMRANIDRRKSLNGQSTSLRRTPKTQRVNQR